MIAVDTNLLVYAHRSDSPDHQRAAACVRELAETARWAIPWACVCEFFAIVTHPRIYRPASTSAQALVQVEKWLASPGVSLLGETADGWLVLRDLIERSKIVGPLIHDARVAALCIQHGVAELWSCDRDFSRFPALRVVNPLVPTRAGERRPTWRRRPSRSVRSPA
jgi:toxin-antitoxin system PIN domain toxin